jgi:hypothetical protein
MTRLGITFSFVNVRKISYVIAVYANNMGSSCEVSTAGGFFQLYFFQMSSPGSTAVEFQAVVPPGPTFFGDNSPFTLKQGNFKDGCAIAYGSCFTGHIYLGSTAFGGTEPACSIVLVKNHPIPSVPGATSPIAVDCAQPSHFQTLRGSYATFNPTTECHCPGTIPTEESSWGKIKSMYE